MGGPEIKVDLKKIQSNTAVIVDFCRRNGIKVTGVTKSTCGMPLVGRAMLDGGVVSLGESRIENMRRMRYSGINAPMMMLRIPPFSQVNEIVEYADISLNSELPIIRSLSEAAISKGKVHKIILMIDLGDLREGIWPPDLLDITREVVDLKGVRIAGVGTNLTCFGGILPTEENMNALVGHAESIEEKFGLNLEIISGGNSSSLPLLLEGKMPKRINHLRIGEAIVLGKETVNGSLWPGCRDDAFLLSAEIIELKKKPSMPIGRTGRDAFGQTPFFADRGEILRCILSVGREDVLVENLTPVDSSISILGASSDHLLLDVTKTASPLSLGDQVYFKMNYGALLSAMTSKYVMKTPITEGDKKMTKPDIIMVGNSPLFRNKRLLEHIDNLGFKHEVSDLRVTEDLIGSIAQDAKFPFIGGEQNLTETALSGMSRKYAQLGLIILSPYASLLSPEQQKNANYSYLSEVLEKLSSLVSPESTAIIGLREAGRTEVEKIRELGIQVYSMEDVDLLGMREIMISSLRIATTGTEGFYARVSTDVVNADGAGLTFREAHLAMEMIANSTGMRAFDISGTPDKSWIDDEALGGMVESAFGKRIIQ